MEEPPAETPEATVLREADRVLEGGPFFRLSPAEARERFRGQIADWARAGRTRFTVRDLAEILEITGRARPWIYDQVALLEREGLVTSAGYGAGWTIQPLVH